MAGVLCGRIFGARSRRGVVNSRYLKVGIMVTLLSSEVEMERGTKWNRYGIYPPRGYDVMIPLGIQINDVIANVLITYLMYLPSMVCVSSTYRRFTMTCPGFPCCIPYLPYETLRGRRSSRLPTYLPWMAWTTYLVLTQSTSHRPEAGV